MHDHSGKILRVVVDAHQGAHVEGAAILARASVDVHRRVGGLPGAHPHADAALAFHPVDDEFAPPHRWA